MSRVGQGQWVRPATTSGSTWRGLMLRLDFGSALDYSGGGSFAVPFDVVVVDTDGIYNGTNGGVVPPGMAGPWRFSGQALCDGADTGGLGSLFLSINGAPFAGDDQWQSYWALDCDVTSLMFGWSPIVAVLAEGDELKMYAGTAGAGSAFVEPRDTYMLMEYLGAVP